MNPNSNLTMPIQAAELTSVFKKAEDRFFKGLSDNERNQCTDILKDIYRNLMRENQERDTENNDITEEEVFIRIITLWVAVKYQKNRSSYLSVNKWNFPDLSWDQREVILQEVFIQLQDDIRTKDKYKNGFEEREILARIHNKSISFIRKEQAACRDVSRSIPIVNDEDDEGVILQIGCENGLPKGDMIDWVSISDWVRNNLDLEHFEVYRAVKITHELTQSRRNDMTLIEDEHFRSYRIKKRITRYALQQMWKTIMQSLIAAFKS